MLYCDWSNYKLDVIVAGESSVKTSHLGAVRTGPSQVETWRGVEIIQNTQRSSHLSFPFEKKLLQSSRDKTEIRETEAAPETLLSKHSSRQGREETEETRKTLARFLYWFNATRANLAQTSPACPVCRELSRRKKGIKYHKGFPGSLAVVCCLVVNSFTSSAGEFQGMKP